MKTQFMALWDGLLSEPDNRILVIGATNRPMDLDTAILRRLPYKVGDLNPLLTFFSRWRDVIHDACKICTIFLSKHSKKPSQKGMSHREAQELMYFIIDCCLTALQFALGSSATTECPATPANSEGAFTRRTLGSLGYSRLLEHLRSSMRWAFWQWPLRNLPRGCSTWAQGVAQLHRLQSWWQYSKVSFFFGVGESSNMSLKKERERESEREK